MPGAAAFQGIGLGANLVGGLLKTRSERNRLKKLRREMLANLQQFVEQRQARGSGLSEGEGGLFQAVTNRALQGAANSGTLRSTFTPGRIAQAIAPIQAQRDRELQGLDERILAQRQSIASGTSLPGFGGAFGGAFQEAGDLAFRAAGARLQKADNQQTLLT